MAHNNDNQSPSRNPPQPPHRMTWQVLQVVASSSHLDPKTLAAASCVSRSWSVSLSSNHLWKPHFTAAFPSLASAATTAASHVSYRHLYSVCHVAAAKRRRTVTPPKPRLCLSDLNFTVHIEKLGGGCVLMMSKSGRDLLDHPEGLFLFDIDVGPYVGMEIDDVMGGEEVRIVWNAVLGDWKAVFVMMDMVGKVRFGSSSEAEGWFSDELPAAHCCLRDGGGGGGSGISADLKLGFCCGRGGGRRVERVSVGMMSVLKWRYLSVEDGLRYLQCFLLPHG